MGTSDIDWDQVQKKYDELKSEFRGWRLFGDEEFERLKLSRQTFGLINADNWDQINLGTAVYVARTGDGINAKAMVQVALEVGVQLSPSLQPPEYIIKNQHFPDHFGHIEDAIKKRTPSNDFLESWARLHVLLRQFQLIQVSKDASVSIVKLMLTGAKNSTEVQRYWFAHWMKENTKTLSRKELEDAGLMLAELCNKIADGTTDPWGPYPRCWYEVMLDEETQDLKDEYYKIGKPKIQKMIASPIMTRTALPPLTMADFINGPEGCAGQ